MEKARYIQEGVLGLTRSSIAALLPYGALFLALLSALDYFVVPEHFSRFLVYRLIASCLVMLLFFGFKLKRNKGQVFLNLTIIAATLIPSAMVEAMILSFNGHQSMYYAGMIIVIIFILGFLIIPFSTCVVVATLVYISYLVPILFFDKITDSKMFLNNNIFLIAAMFGALGWRYFNLKLIMRNFALEYDLSRDKEKLARYSTQLEELVEERTRELNKSETMLRALFDNANDGIMIMDKDGIILNLNQKACDIHGFQRETLMGTNIRLLETQENLHVYQKRLERILNGESLLFETQHYRRDGSKISLEISSKAIEVEGVTYVQSFHRDITEKKRLQEQLFQSQKMESIGVLAGGIAHDFNNILSAILGHAELLHEFSNLDEAGKQRVRIIETSARKAGQMISKLLSFARKGSFETVPLNLNDIVKDTVDLMDRMMAKKNVVIKTDIDSTIPSIAGDANQLEQVVMNIIVNAGDVMPKGGLITIRTMTADLEQDANLVHPLLLPGKYVVLRISDTGPGIPEGIRDKIFDPFFTTKEPGKGTGLGLAMVYGIVKEHQGVITFRTQPGRGTTFEIYLPASGKLMERVERHFVSSMAGREKILVVDDEEDILSFIKDVLESQGYKVVATTNPVYALDLFKEISETVDLVISDIIMPLVNGRELIRHFKLIKPSVRIMAISGYEAGMIDKRDKDINAFIRKPFEGIYLLTVVRRVLDAADSPSRHMPF